MSMATWIIPPQPSSTPKVVLKDVDRDRNLVGTSSITPRKEYTCRLEIGFLTDDSDGQVTWDGDRDPEHPQNWPTRRKWTTLLPMSLYNFLSSMSSATMAPALSAIQQDLDFDSSLLAILSLTIFLLGTAFIPLFMAPLSEVFGRSLVLQSANVFYIVFNTVCGAAKTSNQLILFRFLAGLGGAVPCTVSPCRFAPSANV